MLIVCVFPPFLMMVISGPFPAIHIFIIELQEYIQWKPRKKKWTTNVLKPVGGQESIKHHHIEKIYVADESIQHICFIFCSMAALAAKLASSDEINDEFERERKRPCRSFTHQ
jgi:hypothetical protein